MKPTLYHFACFIVLSGVLFSCSSTRTVLKPAASQPTKWMDGSEVATDTSTNLHGSCKATSGTSTVQFLVHLVNKGVHAVLIDPTTIFTYQTNQEDHTSVHKAIQSDRRPSSPDVSSSSSIAPAVAVGLLALVVVSAIVISSKQSNTTPSKPSDRDCDRSNRNQHYRNDQPNCSSSNDSRNISSPSYNPSTPQPAINYLKKNTLDPGNEMKGIVEVGVIENLRKLVLVIPGVSTSDTLRFNYDAHQLTE